MTTTTTIDLPTVEITLARRHKLRRVSVPAHWVGSALAIHRPCIVDGDGDTRLADTGWVLTHLATGALVAICGNRRKLERLARAWDERMGQVRTVAGMKTWAHRNALGLAVMNLR